jgi:ribonuclease BN (tRNA processing enzyme)
MGKSIDRLVAGVPNATSLKQSILSHHTTAEDAGRVAQAAGVKILVLSHLVPAEDPAVTDQMRAQAERLMDGCLLATAPRRGLTRRCSRRPRRN